MKFSSNNLYVVRKDITSTYYSISDSTSTKKALVAFKEKRHCMAFINCINVFSTQTDINKYKQKLICVPVNGYTLTERASRNQLKVAIYDDNLDCELIDVNNDINDIRYSLEDVYEYHN